MSPKPFGPLRYRRLSLEEETKSDAAEVLSALSSGIHQVEAVEADISAPATAGKKLDSASVHDVADGTIEVRRAASRAGRESSLRILMQQTASRFNIGTDTRFSGDHAYAAVDGQNFTLNFRLEVSDGSRRFSRIVGGQVEEGNDISPRGKAHAKARRDERLLLWADGGGAAGNRYDGAVCREPERPTAGHGEVESPVLAWGRGSLRQGGNRQANQRQHGRKYFVHYPFCRRTAVSSKRFDTTADDTAMVPLRRRSFRGSVGGHLW
jgi:hypothetical protein